MTAKFKLGNTVATIGITEHVEDDDTFQDFVQDSLGKHMTGNWGVVCDEDKQLNNEALEQGERLVSKYTHSDRLETSIYIITEWDRSVTTVLLPEEY